MSKFSSVIFMTVKMKCIPFYAKKWPKKRPPRLENKILSAKIFLRATKCTKENEKLQRRKKFHEKERKKLMQRSAEPEHGRGTAFTGNGVSGRSVEK